MSLTPSATRVAEVYKMRNQKSCSGLLITDGNRVLLLMRSSKVHDPNLWGIPGGHVSEGEDSLSSAIRESLEEMEGLPEGDAIRSYQLGRYRTYIWVISPQDMESFVPVLNWEHTSYGVFPTEVASRLPEIHPGVREVINLHWGD